MSYEEFSKLTPNDAALVDREGLPEKPGIRMKLIGPVLDEEGMYVFEWWGESVQRITRRRIRS